MLKPERICDYLLPNHDSHLTPEGESLQCLRKKHHKGDHLVQLSEGRNGKFIAWGPDPDCDCEDCQRGDYCESFLYREVPEKEAQELIGK